MTATEKELLHLIKTRAFRDDGPFTLSSGQSSPYYIDGKLIEVHSRSTRLIGEVLYEHTKDLEIDAIGGLEVGAVPMTAAAVMAYDLHGEEMEGFWVRDKAKSHGTGKQVEGKVGPGDRVVIVDDVITTGSSAMRAIEVVRNLKCEVVAVIALVDRLTGAEDRFRSLGIQDYRALFTIRDLGVKQDVARPREVATVG